MTYNVSSGMLNPTILKIKNDMQPDDVNLVWAVLSSYFWLDSAILASQCHAVLSTDLWRCVVVMIIYACSLLTQLMIRPVGLMIDMSCWLILHRLA